MRFLIDTYKKTGELHHAYILEGEKGLIREQLFLFLEKDLKQQIKANPDLWHSQYETLTIDDARALRDIQANKAITSGRKIFIIETRFMTVEAQNALLKVFEEPTPNTHFFIITPTAEVFLPTLRSRVVRVAVGNKEAEKNDSAQDFIKSSYKARMEVIAKIVEEKDKGRAIELVDGLLSILHKTESIKIVDRALLLHELLSVRSYLNDRSPSLKLLLEHAALIVPVLE